MLAQKNASKIRELKLNPKHLDNFIKEALTIEADEARAAGALGYMARALVQATMPHKKTDKNEFIRKNGTFTLSILTPSQIGLPYGSLPRLLIAWLTTEAVIKKYRTLSLGDTLTEFMGQLGLVPTGGRWGSITRLREQTKRLFTASISCFHESEFKESERGFRIADGHDLWWTPKSPGQATLFESTVTLSESFFKEITENPIPVDMRALKALSRSPLALDIYCWLTYRMSYIRKSTNIPWVALQMQFGSEYAHNPQGTRDFKRAFIRELKKVSMLYPAANLDSNAESLILKPSTTHIARIN